MPSISITFPAPSDTVGTSFTAYGPFGLDIQVPPDDSARPIDNRVEAYVMKGGTRYDATSSSLGSGNWQANFSGIPTGTGATLHVTLHVGANTYDATPVNIANVLGMDGIGGIGPGPGPSPPPTPPTGAGREMKAAGGGAAPRAAGAPKAIPIHHMVSGAVADDVMRKLRGISAAYFVNGVQLTRVFDAELDPVDGDYHLRMDLRRAASAGLPGSILFRIELWPNQVVMASTSNLIVTE